MNKYGYEMSVRAAKDVARMRRTDYFSDDEAADTIQWLIDELSRAGTESLVLLNKLHHANEQIKKLDTTVGAYYK